MNDPAIGVANQNCVTPDIPNFLWRWRSAFWFLLVSAALILHGGIVMALTSSR